MKLRWRMVVFLAVALVPLLLHAIEPPAAVLKRMQGSVLVNKGEVFRSVAEGAALRVGDRIMLLEGASATLVYDDGCVADFDQNQIITVREKSTCEGAMAFMKTKGPLYSSPLGVVGAASTAGGISLSTGATVGAVGTAAVLGAAALAQDSSISSE